MAQVLISTKNITRQEWLDARRKGIGGSDVAKICGISRWGTPLSVYMDKRGELLSSEDDGGSEAMYWGTLLEDVVAKEFQRRMEIPVRRRNAIFRADDAPYMLANIDREVVGENKGLEIKTTNAFQGGDWEGDSVPDQYYLQVQHYIEVMGWHSCWIAVLVGGQKFSCKEILRDSDTIGWMVETERRFWEDHVLPGVPPPLCALDDLQVVHPFQETDEMLEPTEEDFSVAKDLLQAKAFLKDAEERVAILENTLKDRIGARAGIKNIATWKSSKGSISTDWEALANSVTVPKETISKHIITTESVDWKGVATECGFAPEQVAAFTKEKPGSRRFLFKFKG